MRSGLASFNGELSSHGESGFHSPATACSNREAVDRSRLRFLVPSLTIRSDFLTETEVPYQALEPYPSGSERTQEAAEK